MLPVSHPQRRDTASASLSFSHDLLLVMERGLSAVPRTTGAVVLLLIVVDIGRFYSVLDFPQHKLVGRTETTLTRLDDIRLGQCGV
jgi:hypothetical protein